MKILKSWGKIVICYGFPAIVKHQPESAMNPCLKNPDLAAGYQNSPWFLCSRSTNFITQQMHCRKVPRFLPQSSSNHQRVFQAFALAFHAFQDEKSDGYEKVGPTDSAVDFWRWRKVGCSKPPVFFLALGFHPQKSLEVSIASIFGPKWNFHQDNIFVGGQVWGWWFAGEEWGYVIYCNCKEVWLAKDVACPKHPDFTLMGGDMPAEKNSWARNHQFLLPK